MNLFQLLWEILYLRSELNNKCSGLIGGTVYVAITLTLIITLVPRLFA